MAITVIRASMGIRVVANNTNSKSESHDVRRAGS